MPVLWLWRSSFSRPPIEAELPPEDPALWFEPELCVFSDELAECVLEKPGLSCELEMLLELLLEERSGVGAGAGELWAVAVSPAV